MRASVILLSSIVAMSASAALPPAPEAAKEQAAAAAAKSAWSDKVAAYKLCMVQDQIAAEYRRSQGAKATAQPVATPGCTDPGPFAATPTSQKPLEAAGAHSPPGTAQSPPSTRATAAELMGKSPK